MSAHEVNFDGIVGPTHNYAGLSYGNLASQKHGRSVSSPRRAALEGLAKMKFLADLGVRQAILPPQLRPDIGALRRLGFSGHDSEVVAQAHRDAPHLLAACSSASAMWAANAATVSPSADCSDGRVHITPANLASTLHRSIETNATARVLRAIFPDSTFFAHHDALPSAPLTGDEGAANHTRLCVDQAGPGIEIFAFGRSISDNPASVPRQFPARQTLEASQSIARLHGLREDAVIYARQNPAAIDAGVFHNDVACVGHRNVLLIHAQAWADQSARLEEIRARFKQICNGDLHVIEIGDDQLTLTQAVQTYLFNSQIVSIADGSIALIAPIEAAEHDRARSAIERIIAGDNPISAVYFLDVRQSMRNGGGPACLRLRVTVTHAEQAAMSQRVLWNDDLHRQLVPWVERWYRDELRPSDLADPKLLEEARGAQKELMEILALQVNLSNEPTHRTPQL